MSRIRLCVSILLAVALMSVILPVSAEDHALDVVDGYVMIKSYKMKLADVSQPIVIDTSSGETIVYLKTENGTIEMYLGEGTVSVSDRAAAYVTRRATAPATSAPVSTAAPASTKRPSQPTVCPDCGDSLKEDDHNICPRCNRRNCVHDEFKCSYRANPAPTQFHTVTPEGQYTRSYVAPDGSYMAGVPQDGVSKHVDWAPAVQWLADNPGPTHSPSPSPTPYR